MLDRALQWAYARWGARYPKTALAIQFQASHFVVLAGVALLTVYEPMSEADFLRILVVTQALVLLDNLVALVVIAYGVMLRFFATELILRPVVRDVARALPDGAALPHAGLSLRVKLLAGVPLISIITGVVVAGLSSNGHANLSDLGLDVIVAVAVALTLGFELTLLLVRAILGPIDDLRAATRR